MFVWRKLKGDKRPVISHMNDDSFSLETIPSDSVFIRSGNGTTVITGKIEHVNVTVNGDASLRMEGEVGPGCKFLKEGSGILTFVNAVANDLELTVYGQGNVVFTQQPSANVINSIKRPIGNAQITCAGTVLPPPQQGYQRHNLGVTTGQAVREPQLRQTSIALSRLSTEKTVPAATSEDGFNSGTKKYIERYQKRQTIADRIAELNLAPEEEYLFKRFEDGITHCYFDDIPVRYEGSYYGVSSLLAWYEINKTDPATRDSVKLDAYASASHLYGELEDVIVELKKMRALKNETTAAEQHSPVNEEKPGDGPSM